MSESTAHPSDAQHTEDQSNPPRPDPGEFLGQFEDEPWRLGLLSVMRQLDALAGPDHCIGRGPRTADEIPVRLGQDVDLRGLTSGLSSITPPREPGAPWRIGIRSLGLFGPSGPMPAFMSELQIQGQQDPELQTSLGAFADIFHHRVMTLFYRAWTEGEPTARPWLRRDRADTISALIGRAGEFLGGFSADSARSARLHAGHFACDVRYPEGLQKTLADALQVPVDVVEFLGEWLPIPETSLTALGKPSAALGGAVLGEKIWSVQHRFLLVVGPLDYDQYLAMLPGGDDLLLLTDLVQEYLGDALDYDIELQLRRPEAPPLCLDGSHRLGLTSFLSGSTDGVPHRLRLDSANARRAAAAPS